MGYCEYIVKRAKDCWGGFYNFYLEFKEFSEYCVDEEYIKF